MFETQQIRIANLKAFVTVSDNVDNNPHCFI